MIESRQKQLLKVAANHLVQQQIIEAMFDCMSRGGTGVSDVWEYIEEPENAKYPEEIAIILFDEQCPIEPEEIEYIINNSKQILKDSLEEVPLL
jgi:hypothetical protein